MAEFIDFQADASDDLDDAEDFEMEVDDPTFIDNSEQENDDHFFIDFITKLETLKKYLLRELGNMHFVHKTGKHTIITSMRIIKEKLMILSLKRFIEKNF